MDRGHKVPGAFSHSKPTPENASVRHTTGDVTETRNLLPSEPPLLMVRLAGNNVRIHIVGPRRARASDAIPLTIYVENVRTEPIRTWHRAEFGLQVNGKPLVERADEFFLGVGLSAQYRPLSVMALSHDLGPYLKQPGSYQVRYGDGKTVPSSNAVTIEVVP